MVPDEYDVLNSVLDDDVAQFVRAMTPETDSVFDEMVTHNVNDDFPIVGPEVGGTLRIVARMTGANRAFEFGSGKGYSAYWIAPALPSDGEIVLTDFDGANLDEARSFFERGGYADLARFEVGDALETYRQYDGQFDFVLIDNLEQEYLETFELVEDDVPSGGVICADNVMAGPAVQEDRALAALRGDPDWDAMDETTAGVVRYLQHVRDEPNFETSLLPVGEGLVVSVKK
ncbi:O-methyltransferase [Halomicrobium urmianum]|uniref:O-methyltransferase n=1 Tax=Halomicrobium urmianum TaxID=1586233 RepID=UPI001CD99502|nr:O-methyltransferase [Halomicrobium urmianum]